MITFFPNLSEGSPAPERPAQDCSGEAGHRPKHANHQTFPQELANDGPDELGKYLTDRHGVY